MVVLTRVLAAVVAAWLMVCPSAARAQETLERDVKAAFLYNFTKYIVWPAQAFQAPSDPFRLCVAADADFRESVQALIVGEKVAGRPLRMEVAEPGRISRCQILFVSQAHGPRAGPLLAEAAGRPVLTVVEDEKTFGPTVAILLAREGSRVRFEIDLNVASRVGLTVDPKLVRVARGVRQGSAR